MTESQNKEYAMDWVTEEDLSVFVLPECKNWNALEEGQTLSVKITGRNNHGDKLGRDLPKGMLHSQMHLVLLENQKSVFWKVQATIDSSSRIGFLSAYGLSPLYLLSFSLELY